MESILSIHLSRYSQCVCFEIAHWYLFIHLSLYLCIYSDSRFYIQRIGIIAMSFVYSSVHLSVCSSVHELREPFRI